MPDVKSYHVYYTELNCYKNENALLKTVCDGFVDLLAGFLLFYNTNTKTGYLLNVSNSYYIDSEIEMNFIVDKNYKIQLTEMGTTDGDVDEDNAMISESYLISKHLIEIGVDGLIRITELD